MEIAGAEIKFPHGIRLIIPSSAAQIKANRVTDILTVLRFIKFFPVVCNLPEVKIEKERLSGVIIWSTAAGYSGLSECGVSGDSTPSSKCTKQWRGWNDVIY